MHTELNAAAAPAPAAPAAPAALLPAGEEGAELAAKWYAQAAAKGFRDAAHKSVQTQYKLAHMYLKDRADLPAGTAADRKTAGGELLTKVAKSGHPEAPFELAELFKNGKVAAPKGITQLQMAVQWYKKAVEKGHPQACYELGQLYEEMHCTDKGGERVFEEAVRLYRVAARKNNPSALYRLGELYLTGGATPEDAGEQGLRGKRMSAKEAAADCFRRAVDGGNPDAQFMLGRMLVAEETGVVDGKPNYKEAARRFAQAAKQGHTRAMFELARLYVEGFARPEDGTSPDEAAMALYKQAAELGDSSAQYKLAHIYQEAGMKAEAEKLLTDAAKAGHAEALFELAGMYVQGTAAPHRYLNLNSDDAAFLFYTRAAEKKHSQACYELGCIHEKRYFDRKNEADLTEAVRLYRVADEKGNAPAQYRLGELYRKGYSKPEGADEQGAREETKRLLAQASRQGHKHAQFQYGRMLLEDATEIADKQTAANLLIDAATTTKDRVLQYQLGVLYRDSEAGTENLRRAFDKKAMRWFKKAVNQRYVPSITALGWMYDAGRGGLDSMDVSRREAVKYYKQAKDDEYARSRLDVLTSAGYVDVATDEEAN